jgi:hypothetical protein
MKPIFKYIVIVISVTGATLFPTQKANAQLIVAEVIKKAIVKVIKALDLQVQRLQNKTIVLQNAQKAIENTMSKLKLDEISDWTEKQRKLYADYFEELSKVKSILSVYKRIKAATQMQVALIQEYKRTYSLFKQDKNFTNEEINYMADVYSGIVDESIKNLDQLFLVVSSFTTQMTDAKRLAIINRAADGIEMTYNDLKEFNTGNIQLSIQRSKDMNDVIMIKHLYGLQ